MAVTKLEHVGIMVTSIEKSIPFYCNVIGMERLSTLTTDTQLQLAFLGFTNDSETQIELIEGYNDHLPEEGKVHHVAFAVDDIEQESERIRALGIPFIDQEIQILPNGTRYIFFY